MVMMVVAIGADVLDVSMLLWILCGLIRAYWMDWIYWVDWPDVLIWDILTFNSGVTVNLIVVVVLLLLFFF